MNSNKYLNKIIFVLLCFLLVNLSSFYSGGFNQAQNASLSLSDDVPTLLNDTSFVVNISNGFGVLPFYTPKDSVFSYMIAEISPRYGKIKNISAKIDNNLFWKFPSYMDYFGNKVTFDGSSSISYNLTPISTCRFNITLPAGRIHQAKFNVHKIFGEKSSLIEIEIGNIATVNISGGNYYRDPYSILSFEDGLTCALFDGRYLYVSGRYLNKVYIYEYDNLTGTYIPYINISLGNLTSEHLVEYKNYILGGYSDYLIVINKSNYTYQCIKIDGIIRCIAGYENYGEIFVSTHNKIYILNDTFSVVNIVDTDEPITAMFADFINDTLICGGFMGNIYVYSIYDGTLIWKETLNVGIISTIAEINDRFFFVGRCGKIGFIRNVNGTWNITCESNLPYNDILHTSYEILNKTTVRLFSGCDYGKFYITDILFTNDNLTILSNKPYVLGKSVVFKPVVDDCDFDGDADVIVPEFHGKLFIFENMTYWKNYFLNSKGYLQNYIETHESYSDDYGNEFVSIPIYLSSNNYTDIILNSLNITYSYTVVSNITSFVNNDVSYHELVFEGEGNGSVYVKIRIKYKICPPQLFKNIPGMQILEDSATTTPLKLADISNYFWDDKPESLQFYVYGGNEYVQGYIEDGHYFSVRAAPNWYGNATFRIKAVDSDGFYVYSNPFNITVLPVDDAPCVLPLSDMKIRANKTYYLDLSTKIWDIDSPSLNITTSDPSNVVPLSNYTLKIRYSIPGNYTVMIYVSDGNLTNQTSLNITVVPYSAPLWIKEIPDVVTYKNEPLDEQNSPINLRDFVEDPDTPVDSLAFEIVSQSDPHIDVSISPSGKVLVNPEENYVGTSTVVVRVSDSQYSDITSFRVVVKYKNYPPVYLGGLSSRYYVKEDTVWKVNLAEHFDDLETPSDKLLYRASSPEIIINGSYAYWMPKHGDKSIYNLTFYAYDNASDYAVSDPITLIYVEVNDPPVYLGGLTDITIKEGERLILNLSSYFADEETPDSLIFGCNITDITINGSIAEYSGSKSLKNVVFYAIDPQNSSLIAYSNPINITVIPKNKPPKAYIDEIRIIQGGVILRGHGVDVDGSVVKYEWYSSKDGFLGNAEYLQVKLSPGKHVISFRVMDNNGTWSNYTYREIIIPEFNYGQIVLYGGISLIICGSGLIAATYLSIWGWRRRTAISG